MLLGRNVHAITGEWNQCKELRTRIPSRLTGGDLSVGQRTIEAHDMAWFLLSSQH